MLVDFLINKTAVGSYRYWYSMAGRVVKQGGDCV